MPHLSPIEHPKSLFLRVLYAYSRRRFGKVLTVMKIVYARQPRLALLAQKVVQTQEKLSLEPSLRFLIQAKVSQLNGCAFCEDITLAQALQKNIGLDRFRDLFDISNSTSFSPREKAALAFVEEATVARKVSEATWQQVRSYFSDTEIVELTWLNASENYFNLQAAVLGIGSDCLAEGVAG
ncbi:hypothetical protein IAD21_02872 [Abditibacteriota bacterium]|nr:hypothetical protein IAD21_02872 [Abditibacteriota bacterium]